MKKNSWIGPPDRLTKAIVCDLQHQDPEILEEAREHLENLHTDLRKPFLDWLETGRVDPSLEVEGYTIARIQEKIGSSSVTAAFSWLDELMKDPKEAIDLLNYPVSVRYTQAMKDLIKPTQ